ncbi:MAG: UDP-N-acetyl-D-mannosaminuronic acid dehydrogenase, partial [Flavobacteriaceae bacterium]
AACARIVEDFLIAVPTPFKANHKPDLSYLKSAALSIAKMLKPSNLVILEFTCPVGTTDQLYGVCLSVSGDL